MNYPRTLAMGLILLLPVSSAAIADTNGAFTHASKTPGTETPISRTIELQTLAKRWRLDEEEYQRYLDLMRGPLGKWSPDLDPLLALGMFAESPQEEQRYAELYAQQEFDLTGRTTTYTQTQTRKTLAMMSYHNQNTLSQPQHSITTVKQKDDLTTTRKTYHNHENISLVNTMNLDLHL